MNRGLPWFRMYVEAVDDEKLRLLAFEDRWHYVALLCCKASGLLDTEDNWPMVERKVAVKLGVQVRELEEIHRRLMEVALVDESLQPTGWDKRQYRSDESSERVRRYRQRVRESGRTVGGYEKHRSALLERDEAQCVYCGATEQLCIDHMIPVSQGGGDDIDNLAIACKACNSGKSGRTPEAAGLTIKTKEAREAYERAKSCNRDSNDQSQFLARAGADTDTDTDTEPEGRPARSRGATDPPASLEITDAMRQWFAEKAIPGQPEEHAEAMLDWHRANGKRRKDWVATWKNWCRNAVKFEKRDSQKHIGETDETRRRSHRKPRAVERVVQANSDRFGEPYAD